MILELDTLKCTPRRPPVLTEAEIHSGPVGSRGYYPKSSKRSQGRLPPETSVGIDMLVDPFGDVCAFESSCHFHCIENARDRFRVVLVLKARASLTEHLSPVEYKETNTMHC